MSCIARFVNSFAKWPEIFMFSSCFSSLDSCRVLNGCSNDLASIFLAEKTLSRELAGSVSLSYMWQELTASDSNTEASRSGESGSMARMCMVNTWLAAHLVLLRVSVMICERFLPVKTTRLLLES